MNSKQIKCEENFLDKGLEPKDKNKIWKARGKNNTLHVIKTILMIGDNIRNCGGQKTVDQYPSSGMEKQNETHQP